MDHRELRFEVRRFCGAPMVAAEGQMDESQCDTLRSLLRSFNWRGHADMIVDLARMRFAGEDGAEALVKAMRSWLPEMIVHVVATGEVAEALSRQPLPFRSHLCASVDEAAERICRSHRMVYDLAEKSIRDYGPDDLPLAA